MQGMQARREAQVVWIGGCDLHQGEETWSALQVVPGYGGQAVNRDERLNNWARWVRVTVQYRHCMSLEGRYKAPRNDEEHNDHGEIDALDAAKIEKVICHPGFPVKMRELLKADYVLRMDYRKACRQLGIRFSEYDIEVRRAELMVWNRMKEKRVFGIDG